MAYRRARRGKPLKYNLGSWKTGVRLMSFYKYKARKDKQKLRGAFNKWRSLAGAARRRNKPWGIKRSFRK